MAGCIKISVLRPERYLLWPFFISSLLFYREAAWLAPSSTRILRVNAFHDCVQSRKRTRNRDRRRLRRNQLATANGPQTQTLASCADGICVGMTNGPHQGGNASYPVAWNGTAGTRLKSYMTVPKYPSGLATKDDFSEITYYIWTDVFFGDESFGRMNQLVPQLILGSALDGSSGPPRYGPRWNTVHDQWAFGAHYYFEVWNPNTNTTDSHAAYGDLFHAAPGETLLTTFELSLPSGSGPVSRDIAGARTVSDASDSTSPAWTLTMSVVGDPARTSVLTVSEPYMGIGSDWIPQPSTSWLEPHFRNMCINACWELYGASDPGKLPASGAEYRLTIEQPRPGPARVQPTTPGPGSYETMARSRVETAAGSDPSDARSLSDDEPGQYYYDFTTWEQDEGNGVCPSCSVVEAHTRSKQQVFVTIDVIDSDGFAAKTEAS